METLVVNVAWNEQMGKYVAVCETMTTCYSVADTSDGAIEKFEQEYAAMLQMFKGQIEFEFKIKRKPKVN